jgi:hypothetical protein
VGRIVISVSVQNITNAEQRIRCDTLVDTDASHPVLPSAWRGPPRRSRGTGHGRARAGKSAVDQGCGEEQEVKTNTGRRRVNINGAIDLERLEPVVRFHESINAESTIALFEQLEALNLVATWIYVICDNARYYRSKAVQEYLTELADQAHFPATIRPEPQPDRAILEILQENDPIQPLL